LTSDRGRKEAAGALDQVVLILGRGAEGFSVSAGTAFANVTIGIEAAFEGEDADFEAFLGEEGDGFFGGVGSGRIGIEVDDDAGGVAAQQARLRFSECGAAGGDDVGDAGEENGDAVHLALDEDCAAVAADGLAGPIEIEEGVTF